MLDILIRSYLHSDLDMNNIPSHLIIFLLVWLSIVLDHSPEYCNILRFPELRDDRSKILLPGSKRGYGSFQRGFEESGMYMGNHLPEAEPTALLKTLSRAKPLYRRPTGYATSNRWSDIRSTATKMPDAAYVHQVMETRARTYPKRPLRPEDEL